MHEIKLLLSAKLCAVTVFASCRSKNVRYFTTTQTTLDNMVRAVRCEQKIQPRITQIGTNGDDVQKFFGLPKKILATPI